MSKSLTIRFIGLVVLLSSMLYCQADTETYPQPWPQFIQNNTEAWLQSPPLTTQDFRGKVVLMDIWTFACWNCYRSFPWLNNVQAKYQTEGLAVLGIHSPEFAYEKMPESVIKKMQEFQLHHPAMLDNDFRYWRALNNRYWPTFYLIDKQGQIRYRFVGETHANTPKAQKIEKVIETLLAE
ncbi:MAG: redoxin family protein [Gammaproteobacteria bacterium]|nr:redoxin family protein [Gammaproteobacteria bacterium]